MKAVRTGLIILICFVAAVIIALLAMLVVGISRGGTDMDFFSSGGTLANRQVFPVDTVAALNISYRSDSVNIIPISGDEIILEEYLSDANESMLATITQNGGTLSISGGKRPIRFFLWFAREYINIYVPSGWLGDLSVESSSGSVKAEDNFTLNSLSLQSSSGSVRLGNVNSKGNVELHSSSGSLHCGNITAEGSVSVSSSSGSVHAGIVSGAEISLKSSSGSVKAEKLQADSVYVKSGSGSVTLEELVGTFTLENSSGSIRINGGSGHGTAESTSGSVKIVLGGVDGDLKLKSTSGSVRLEIPANLSFEFYSKTSSGSVNTSFDNSLSYNKSGKEARGTVGASPAFTISCYNSSGSIRVEA